MSVKPGACRALRITALLLLLTMLSIFSAMPLHHAGHLCSGAECPLCLAAAEWRKGCAAPLPGDLPDAAESYEDAGETKRQRIPYLISQTPKSLKTEMDN
ncbi:hypothetical protein [Synergistes jonesii]|uniref:hypothetical protein n=1 Tax=Synergistes jonesii TaxID=2754 RepID=UPI00242AD381|nr:hypothetical protein [Synergistes jonesii]